MWVCYLSLLLLSQGNFRFQPKVCNGCHEMTQKSMSFNNVTIFTVKKKDYMIHWGMTKSRAMIRVKNPDLSEKSRQPWL